MRRQTAALRVAFVLDAVVALALTLSVAFFLVVLDDRLTHDELAHAQLALMRQSAMAAHPIAGHVTTRTR